MVEYGNGIGQGPAGQVGGTHPAGGSVDVGTSLGRFVTDSAHTISTLPPTVLVAGIVLLFVGLMILRRAF